MLGAVGALPEVFSELEVNFFLLRRLLGVRSKEGEKQSKVEKLAKGEVLMVRRRPPTPRIPAAAASYPPPPSLPSPAIAHAAAAAPLSPPAHPSISETLPLKPP